MLLIINHFILIISADLACGFKAENQGELKHKSLMLTEYKKNIKNACFR